MWNQGNNGNGYGQQPQYGQPQQQQYQQQPQQWQGGYEQDVYGRLNNTKEIGGARFPFLEATGKYALCTLEEFMHSNDGPSARALFETLECPSGRHAIGSYVVKIWKLVKPPYKPGMTTDGDLFADFCRKLKGAPAGYPIGNDIRVLMKERPNEQLARGTVIEAVAVPNKKQTWINIYWNAIQQTPQDIAQMRVRCEQKGIPDTRGPQQGGQFQGAPHPSQMQQQYPAQMQQAPQQQPPQGYQMQQGQWQLPPGAQPQQYAPQQVQYTQPVVNGTFNAGPPQQPQQQQAPVQGPQQGAPQGGFLAQIPQGQQGGNNGGGGQW